jgi:small subunit ribosomal protein S18
MSDNNRERRGGGRDSGGRGDQRGGRGDQRGGRGGGRGGRFQRRRRIGRNEFCPDGKCFDYKDVETLNRFVNEVGKIRPRRQSGNCARCQRELAREIKRARFLGLMPFVASHD